MTATTKKQLYSLRLLTLTMISYDLRHISIVGMTL